MKTKAVKNVDSYSLLFQDDRAPMYELFWDRAEPSKITIYMFGKEVQAVHLRSTDSNRAYAKSMGNMILDGLVAQQMLEDQNGI